MNHIIKPIDATTARIVFEFNKGFRNWRKLAIGRIYFFGSSSLVICRGVVLGGMDLEHQPLLSRYNAEYV